MRLLIIGSLEGQVGSASKIAMSRGATVTQADSIASGLGFLRSGKGADLVMIDVKLDVAALIQGLKSERISVPVVACGIGSDTPAAVRAIKAGAKEYIPLPPNTDLIAAVLTAVSEDSRTLVHKDRRMADLLEMADKVAPSDANILITGDSGTGKELLVHYLHDKSRRASGRLVAVNCAAIPETLLESELFGHEKGAFTGAVARRIGKFEEADRGTLLLDEISEMDFHLQAKLLRVVQEREIDRLGGTRPVKIDVRIIATTNRDLEEEVRKGTFREDLFFRLNVVNLRIPKLRERPDDIEVLAEHFIKKYAEANQVEPLPLAPEVRRMLIDHPWPGNVRELENTVHRAVILSTGSRIELEAVTLGGRMSASPQGAADGEGGEGRGHTGMVGRTVSEVERDLIIDTLHHCLGNRTHAATILGISIRTLRNKLKQYNEQGFAVPVPGDGERPTA